MFFSRFAIEISLSLILMSKKGVEVVECSLVKLIGGWMLFRKVMNLSSFSFHVSKP